jgi:hypothetical protein
MALGQCIWARYQGGGRTAKKRGLQSRGVSLEIGVIFGSGTPLFFSSRSSNKQSIGRNPSDAGASAGTPHPRSPSLHRSARTAPPASAAHSHPHGFPPRFLTQSCPSHLCLYLHVQESKGLQQPAHVSPSSGDLRPAQVCATGPRPPFPELGFDLCLLCLYFL